MKRMNAEECNDNDLRVMTLLELTLDRDFSSVAGIGQIG